MYGPDHDRLTADEERALSALIRSPGDGCRLAARDRLASCNLALVRSIARGLLGRRAYCPLPLADLVGHGMVGLMVAVDRFDPARGKFSTLATRCIWQHLERVLMDEGSLVRVPYRTHEQVVRRRRGLPPARKVAASEECLARAERALRPAWSLSQAASWGFDLAAPPAVDAEGCEPERAAELLDRLLGAIPARQALVLRRIFGIGAVRPATLREVAAGLAVSHERVRQIRDMALKRLWAEGARP